MPRTSDRKRKRVDSKSDVVYLGKKLRKLERKIMRGKRRSTTSSSSVSSREREPSPTPATSSSSSSASPRSSRAPTPAPAPAYLEDGESGRNPPPGVESPRPPAPEPSGPEAGPRAEGAAPPAGDAPGAAAARPEPAALEATSTAAAADAAPAPELDDALLQLLGEDPSSTKKFGKDIQKDLAVRLEHVATNGLPKELRKELKERYLIPADCTLIDAPTQNPEIQAAVNESTAKRLKAIEAKQKSLGSAIACLGEALTLLFADTDKNTTQIKLLMDACRILCDAQYGESLTRRGFILSAVKKEMRDRLKDRKIDKFIFGDNLAETLKAAKAIHKTGAELKLNEANKPAAKKTEKSKPSLNWKSPPSNRRSTAPQRTQAPAPSRPRASSSRASRQKPRHSRN